MSKTAVWVDQRTYEALCTVVDYFYPVEEVDWIEAGNPDEHIFRDLCYLNGLVDEIKNEFKQTEESGI